MGSEWSEYKLPDGSFYYRHFKKQIITDIDLTDTAALERVMNHVETSLTLSGIISKSMTHEIWLLEQTTEEDSGIEERWIDHEKRALYSRDENAPQYLHNPDVRPDEQSPTERSTWSIY